ncbi:MAG: hypothetical protein QN122_09945 [Armatimonadota bacterium]|nr:hypothetical protein [Armatimonadota bacterium]MDR7447960.1 hypothetical protein [Armatimonadota bacterium]MDR7458224.1 hypothetical protein [Armatimonadota bacterium]MDR7478471.1 hypothetical protein [Armatimonadota bacterium]MDR7488774.1 hypothetical protein [Armatimonadota bacterium]
MTRKHRARARPRQPAGRRRGYLPWLVAAVVAAAFILMVAALARQPRLPRVGDHWHARFTLEVCGTVQPPFPPSPGDVHTHGDGVIHIHPSTRETSGRAASLGAFFRSVGMRLTPSTLSLPDGRTLRDGERCPDGRQAHLRVLVNGREVRDPLAYVPQDRDQVRVVYGP